MFFKDWNQNEDFTDDGTITVPEVLRPYMGGQEVIEGDEPVGESAVGAGRKE